jgi:type II secretory pathway component PulJ
MRVIQKMQISKAGITLVEVAAVIAISAIVFTGVIIAYSEGVGHWQDTSEEFTLYNEGTAALSLMGRFIRQASFVRIRSYSGVADSRLELDYPEDIGSATFYFVKEDGSIRWNDQTEGRNRFNLRLLPAVNYRQGRDDMPYLNVIDATFTPLDDIGIGSPTLLGYSLVRIDITLESSREDTLQLSSVVSKRN